MTYTYRKFPRAPLYHLSDYYVTLKETGDYLGRVYLGVLKHKWGYVKLTGSVCSPVFETRAEASEHLHRQLELDGLDGSNVD